MTAKYKLGQCVNYRHPYNSKVVLKGSIFEVHEDTTQDMNGTRTDVWYQMNTYGDVHHVGNHVDESQIIGDYFVHNQN